MEDLAARYRLYMEELFNQRDLSTIDRNVVPGLINRQAYPGQPQGAEGLKRTTEILLNAFPDVHIEIVDIIQHENRVIAQWRMTGTHKGTLFGIPASGNQATWTGTDTVSFVDGKVVERWGQHDALALAKQLGIDVRNAHEGTWTH